MLFSIFLIGETFVIIHKSLIISYLIFLNNDQNAWLICEKNLDAKQTSDLYENFIDKLIARTWARLYS